jgi:dTDP-4-dehydrorhamnose 3,5-epimerase
MRSLERVSSTPETVEVSRERVGGPLLIQSPIRRDPRGFFQETYRRSTLEDLGIHCDWVQTNHSRSERGVLRGLHFQVGQGQAKLVWCTRGAIRDVTVDIRRGSPTYGSWESHDLGDEDGALLYVPVGFAHGFCVTSDVADVMYSCSAYYDPSLERRIAYDDPAIGIDWPATPHTVSELDANAPRLAEVADEIPFAFPEPAARR